MASCFDRDIALLLAAHSDTDERDWHGVFKARYGMLVAFEALRGLYGPGAVITQLLTCCTAIDPIIVAGLEPRYLDVSLRTAAIDPRLLVIDDAVRAVVVQHTYGIVDDAETRKIVETAHAAGVPVVEDCAHCVGRMARGEDGAPLADVSIHSFGIEKVLDTLSGGMVWVNPASPFGDYASLVARRLSELPVPPVRLDALARVNRFQLRVFGHIPHSAELALRHGLERLGLFDPAVSRAERSGGLSYGRPYALSPFVGKKAHDALRGLSSNERDRRAVVSVYRERLSGAPGVEVPAAALEGPVQPLLKFPVLVDGTERADAVIGAVCSAGYFTTAWYRPELTPGVLDATAYRVPRDRSALTVNDRMVGCVATLPTNIAPAAAPRVVDAVLGVLS